MLPRSSCVFLSVVCAFFFPWLLSAQNEIRSEKDLASALLEAPTQQVQVLLSQNEKFVTSELWKEIWGKGDEQRQLNNYLNAMKILTLAEAVAERIGDNKAIADT